MNEAQYVDLQLFLFWHNSKYQYWGLNCIMITSGPLFNLLLEAYGPCNHFTGDCSNACSWEPEHGLVPCGFGGAIGSIAEVKLVIVNAEPGDPPDDAKYFGSPIDMLKNSMRLFMEAMERGGLNRTGRPTQFHRNIRYILDCFFPGQNLSDQLKQTWVTNTVLCAAKNSGSTHFKQIEAACAKTYLVPQILIFEHAFILALGDKAKARLSTAGLRFDAVARHPSARVTDVDKKNSWISAAKVFNHGNWKTIYKSFCSLKLNECVGSLSASNELINYQNKSQFNFPKEVIDFFNCISTHADYSYKLGKLQLMVYFRGEKVGGYNSQRGVWYLSKIFISKNSSSTLMDIYNFQHVIKNETHDYWLAPQRNSLFAFKSVVAKITGFSF